VTTTPPAPTGVREPNPAADAPPTAVAAPATSLTPTLGALLRRGRTWIVIAAALLAGAVVLLLVQGGIRTPGPQLGASNPGPQGAQALVEVLRDHGVDAAEARSYDAALEQAKAGATVLLFDEFAVLDDTRLSRLAMFADRLVLVEPGFRALEALAPGVRLAGAGSGTIDEVACTLRPAERAGSLSDGQRLFTVDDDVREDGWQGCFRDGEFGFAVVSGPMQGGGELTLVGATTAFTNERIDEAGNAALAIGLLGASDSLVWYLPGPADADPSAAPSLAELTPGWVSPVMVLAIAVTIAAAVWRGRRFGPLVVEHLPVEVPAGETAEGRARLYARSAARGHALDQLRIGTLTRLAALLKLPRSAHVDTISNAAAAATGRDPASVVRLLIHEHPGDDRALVDLAAELDELEQHVSASLRPGSAAPVDRATTGSPDSTDPTGRRP
jgi:hypothetical protein